MRADALPCRNPPSATNRLRVHPASMCYKTHKVRGEAVCMSKVSTPCRKTINCFQYIRLTPLQKNNFSINFSINIIKELLEPQSQADELIINISKKSLIMFREIRKTSKKLRIHQSLCLKVLLSMYCVWFFETKARIGIDFYRSKVSSLNVLN